MTDRGCEIEDIVTAPDAERISAMVDSFIQAEQLAENPAYARAQEREMSVSGVLDLDTGTLLRMRRVFNNFVNLRREENRVRAASRNKNNSRHGRR